TFSIVSCLTSSEYNDILSFIVLLNKVTSWGTTPTSLLNLFKLIFLISLSSNVTVPLVGIYNPSINLANVLFPAPDFPTMATFSPGLICKDTSLITSELYFVYL